jgi:hypothetical protein
VPILQTPKPTPFVPDVPTFLTLIGRGLSAHASKIPSWDALFSLSSEQLRESGVEPARARRYLLWWRERFRNGIIGVGGDARHVKDGKAELRIVEVPSDRPIDRLATITKGAGMRKVILNVPSTLEDGKVEDGGEGEVSSSVTRRAAPPKFDLEDTGEVAGMRICHGTAIGGKGVAPVRGQQGVAVLKVQEGLWEQRRGHKVDGGERRQAEVRFKRRIQERKNAR